VERTIQDDFDSAKISLTTRWEIGGPSQIHGNQRRFEDHHWFVLRIVFLAPISHHQNVESVTIEVIILP